MEPDRVASLVTPFYLGLMRLNALTQAPAFDPEVVAAARTCTAAEVVELLRDPWRSSAVGAWFALLHDDEVVTGAVLDAVASSSGSLDSPPLVVAAVTLAGERALPALERYARNDAAGDWEACGFAAAAIAHLGGAPSACDPTQEDREDLAGLLALAESLRAQR